MRTHDRSSPFPEEINRQLISRIASLHCASTPGNRDTLIAEGIEPHRIVVTGNPVLDALKDPVEGYYDPRDPFTAVSPSLVPDQPYATYSVTDTALKQNDKPLYRPTAC